MFENPLVYWACFLLLPMLLAGLLGALIAWFLRPKHAGDLNVEGEARLRAEADDLRAKLRAAEAERTTLVEARDGEISTLKGKLAAAAAGAAAAGAATAAVAKGGKDDEETYALEWRNRYLAARVKYLEGRLAEAPEAAPVKAKAKKAPAKRKTAAKTATAVAAAAPKARKKPGPKPGTKRGALNKDGTPRKKPGPKSKGVAKPAGEVALDKYYANVKKFDGSAKRDVVQSIVKYCGVSLRSRDTSLVACSDPKEKDRIVKGFASKKLGVTNIDERRKLVEDICAEMKSTRQKSRVTFYYLMAKRAGKLDVFGG